MGTMALGCAKATLGFVVQPRCGCVIRPAPDDHTRNDRLCLIDSSRVDSAQKVHELGESCERCAEIGEKEPASPTSSSSRQRVTVNCQLTTVNCFTGGLAPFRFQLPTPASARYCQLSTDNCQLHTGGLAPFRFQLPSSNSQLPFPRQRVPISDLRSPNSDSPLRVSALLATSNQKLATGFLLAPSR